jgi:hypothetical protein
MTSMADKVRARTADEAANQAAIRQRLKNEYLTDLRTNADRIEDLIVARNPGGFPRYWAKVPYERFAKFIGKWWAKPKLMPFKDAVREFLESEGFTVRFESRDRIVIVKWRGERT